MSYCNDALVSVSGTAQRKTFLQIGRDGFFKQKVIPFFHRRDSMPDMLAVLCSGAAVNCAQWWIANSDRLTKEEIVRQFEALVTSI